MVSCAGSIVDISLMDLVQGVRFHGSLVADPAPLMLIGFAIPALIFGLVFIRKYEDHEKACAITTASVVDLGFWFILRAYIEEYAVSSHFEFRTGFSFFLNMAVLAGILTIAVPVSVRKLSLDTPITELFQAEEELPLLPEKP